MPETLNNSDSPRLSKHLDSYIEDGKIVIVTKSYSKSRSEVIVNKNYISANRAYEIISDLQDAIKRLTSTK